MKINCYKISQGFIPVDREIDQIKKIPNGSIIEITIKESRNYDFHKKVFAFFNFCFEYWKSDREFMDEQGQFNLFRKNLTALAGYYDEFFNIKGEVRIEAKSLAYDKMDQAEFESFYHALVNCAMKHIFKDADQSMYDQLIGFF